MTNQMDTTKTKSIISLHTRWPMRIWLVGIWLVNFLIISFHIIFASPYVNMSFPLYVCRSYSLQLSMISGSLKISMCIYSMLPTCPNARLYYERSRFTKICCYRVGMISVSSSEFYYWSLTNQMISFGSKLKSSKNNHDA